MQKMLKNVLDWIIITIGIAIVAASVVFFLMPSKLSVGGITGLAIVLADFVPLPVSVITMALNAVLLVLGFFFIGRDFGAKTVYSTIMLSVFIGLYEQLFPNFASITEDVFVDMICYIFVLSVGQAILYKRNASSGGLDIVAKFLQKYLHMELGKGNAIAGMCIALSSIFIADLKTMVLSVLGTYMGGVVLDYFIFGFNIKKRVCIISKHEDEIRRFILHDLRSGATIYEALGAYDNQVHREIIAIVDKNEYAKLITFLEKCDPAAFVTVYNVNEVFYRPKV